MNSNTSSYTLEEVSQHNTVHSCWMVIHGKVYDVTKFVEKHPGGAEILLDVAGTDASGLFEEIGQHTAQARELMKDYCIGKLIV